MKEIVFFFESKLIDCLIEQNSQFERSKVYEIMLQNYRDLKSDRQRLFKNRKRVTLLGFARNFNIV